MQRYKGRGEDRRDGIQTWYQFKKESGLRASRMDKRKGKGIKGGVCRREIKRTELGRSEEQPKEEVERERGPKLAVKKI